MAAPLGNEFWKLRSKHGRDMLFASPELMWEAACEYFQWCHDTPLESTEYYGRDAQECKVPKMRAFTMKGLCRHLDCSEGYFRTFKLTANEDFLAVITRIEDIIFEQQYTGAAAGMLHANIVSRALGLADKKEVEQRTIVVETPDDDE